MSRFNAVEGREEAIEPEEHDALTRSSHGAQTDVLKDLITQSPNLDH